MPSEGDEDDEPTLGLEALEALRALEADEHPIAGTYGVAGKEAFEALRTGDTDDISDWRAFTGDSPAPAEPAPDPRRFLPSSLIPPPSTSGRPPMPSRRSAASGPSVGASVKKRKSPKRVRNGWADDKPIPKTWFPEVDEDVVRPTRSRTPRGGSGLQRPRIPMMAFRPPPPRSILIGRSRSHRRGRSPSNDPEPCHRSSRKLAVGGPSSRCRPDRCSASAGSPAEDLFDGNADDLQAGGPWRLDFETEPLKSPTEQRSTTRHRQRRCCGDRDEWDLPDDATEEMSDPGIHLGEGDLQRIL